MTMADGLCGVCKRPGAIGVASTMIPYSCAYCQECAQKGAQPIEVFTVLPDPKDMMEGMADQIVTWKDGRYMTYKEWWES